MATINAWPFVQADDNHSFRVSDDSETHGVKILIDLGAEKKAREFVQRAMYLQEQSQLEEKVGIQPNETKRKKKKRSDEIK